MYNVLNKKILICIFFVTIYIINSAIAQENNNDPGKANASGTTITPSTNNNGTDNSNNNAESLYNKYLKDSIININKQIEAFTKDINKQIETIKNHGVQTQARLDKIEKINIEKTLKEINKDLKNENEKFKEKIKDELEAQGKTLISEINKEWKKQNENLKIDIEKSLDKIKTENSSVNNSSNNLKYYTLGAIIFASIVLLIQVILIIIIKNKSKISDIKNLKNDISDTLDSFQAEVQNNNKSLISGLEAKIPKFDAYSSLINDKVLVLRKDIEKLPSQYPKTVNEDTIKNTINNKIQEIKTQLVEVGRLSENLQNIILRNNNLKDALTHQRSDLERREKSLEKEIALEKEMVKQETTTTLKKTFDSEKTGLSLKVNSLTSNNEKLSQELIKAKAIVGKYEEVEHQRQEAQTQLEVEIRKNEKLATELTSIQNNIQERLHTKELELQSQIDNKVRNEINELKTAIDKRDSIIKDKDVILKDLKDKYDNTEKIILMNKSKITECDLKIADNQQKIEKLEFEKNELIERNNISIRTIEDKVNEISKLNQTIKKNKEEYDHQIADKLQTIDSLNTEYEKQNQLMQELETKIYPDIFNQDNDFINLKNHLQQWIVDKIGTTGIIISNLNILALRESMNADSWKLALKNVSLGITLTMRQSKISERQIIDELVSWGKFLMKYSNDKYPYTIQIPKLGDNVDTSWMTAKNNSVVSVNKVLSWAVFHNQYGVQHNAEVE